LTLNISQTATDMATVQLIGWPDHVLLDAYVGELVCMKTICLKTRYPLNKAVLMNYFGSVVSFSLF